MITIVGNIKGGTGKSTVAFNLAVWLSSQTPRVRIFDLDPQKTLTDTIEVRAEEGYEPVLAGAKGVQSLRRTDFSKVDHAVIDVSVADQSAMKTALRMADRLIMPVGPSQADVWSTQQFVQLVQSVDNPKLSMYGFVNRADTNRQVTETEETEWALSQLPGVKVIPVRLYQRTAYRRSFSEGMAVFEMPGSDKAKKEMLAWVKWLENT